MVFNSILYETINSSEVNYGIKSKELLIIINTFNKWKAKLIYLSKFEIITD